MISDGYGYQITEEDLAFLGIPEESRVWFLERSSPLGMSPDEFDDFCSTLGKALAADGVGTCDVRLMGSAAHFFSGYHKFMVWSPGELLELFRSEHSRVPRAPEFARVQGSLLGQWPAEPRPKRRPFDVLHVCRASPDPSDYDVQVSSDEIMDRARARIIELGLDASEARVISETYDFIRKDILDTVCPHVRLWAVEQRHILRRNVSVAAFPGNGPPNREDDLGRLSAHFRASDWVMGPMDASDA